MPVIGSEITQRGETVLNDTTVPGRTIKDAINYLDLHGAAVKNLDGGRVDSNYGGTLPLECGGA